MSTLTVGLIIVGGLIVVAIIAYGAWSVRRSAASGGVRRIQGVKMSNLNQGFGSFASAPAPNSLNAQPVPAHDVAKAGVAALPEGGALHQAERDGAVGEKKFVPGFDASGALLKRPALDALLDSIVAINIERPIYGSAVVAALPKGWRIGSKSFSIEGMNLKTQAWEFPLTDAQYGSFQAGIQLASRSGALNEIEFSEFVQKVTKFAEHVHGEATFRDMLEEVARARELNQFASMYDAQISFVLRSKSVPWGLGFISQSAQALGFVPSALTGRMVLPVESGKTPVLSLVINMEAALSEQANETTVGAFRLILDVSHVAQELKPFTNLCEVAKQLAGRLDAVVVDEEGHEIQDHAIASIERDLVALYDALQAHDFPAGGTLALRLFN